MTRIDFEESIRVIVVIVVHPREVFDVPIGTRLLSIRFGMP